MEIRVLNSGVKFDFSILTQFKDKSMKYKIPVSWQVYGVAEIEANSLQEAIELVEDDAFPLPENAEYVDGSFEIDYDIVQFEYENEPV